MKSLTEFQSHKLVKGIETKNALAAAGKSPEEIMQGLGEAFKLEGDKLKYFTNAIEVASQNLEKLARILVLSFSEGETLPPKAVKIEEQHYVPEFQREAGSLQTAKVAVRGAGGNNKGKKDGPKSSPWGLSPEEKAAKKSAGQAKAKAQVQS
jgi:hypothetical protein